MVTNEPRQAEPLRTMLASIFIVGIVAAPSARGQDEPNDTLQSATVSGVIDVATAVHSNRLLGDGDWGDVDVDIYSFEVTAKTSFPMLMTATVEGKAGEFDSYLRIFDAAGVELANNDDIGPDTTDSKAHTYLLQPGVFYLGVSSASNPRYDPTSAGSGRSGVGGTYTLTLMTEMGVVPKSAFEPNDNVTVAGLLGSESISITGEFVGDGANGRRDVDVYALSVTGTCRVDVSVHAAAIGSILDPVVRVRNCTESVPEFSHVDQCLVASADDSPDGSVDPSVSFGSTVAQTLYVMVSGAGNRSYDPTVTASGEPGSVGPYDLQVDVTYFESSAPDEPNDSTQMPIRLVPFSTSEPNVIEVEGHLGDGRFAPLQGDRDFFEVTVLDEAKWIAVDVAPSADSTLDPVVVVYDVDGNLLAANERAGGATAGVVLPINCVPAKEGTRSMYVGVVGTMQRLSGDPNFPLEGATIVFPESMDDGPGSTGEYQMTVTSSAVSDYCSIEGDNTISSATPTGLTDEGRFVCVDGEIGDGSCVDPYADVDMWSIDVGQAPAVLQITVTGCREDALPCHSVSVFDSFGERLHFVAIAFGHLFPPPPVILREPGTYFVAVTGDIEGDFDPTTTCSAAGSCLGTYDLIMTLTPSHSSGPMRVQQPEASTPLGAEVMFASRLDDRANEIDTIDSVTGVILNTFPAPEVRFGGGESLAFDGTHLYFVGTGHHPMLYRMDPVSGDVLGEFILWMGSGYYGEAAVLNGELFLVDLEFQSIHVLDPVAGRLLRTLDVGSINDVVISGGLAASSWPERLYVAGAFEGPFKNYDIELATRKGLYEIDPHSGILIQTLSRPPSNCCHERLDDTCCDDAMCCGMVCTFASDCCFYAWSGECVRDVFSLCQDLCFPENSLLNRPLSLSCIGGSELHVVDWSVPVTEVVDHKGIVGPGIALPFLVGSLAGLPCAGLVGDFNRDGDVDLEDFGAVQLCFTGESEGADPSCDVVDADQDKKIDLSDFANFVDALSGPN